MASLTNNQGTNAERSRLHNRQAVLGCIHAAGQMGRAEIARALGLSTQAVSNIMAELSRDGLLVERGARSAGRGLPAIQYAVNPDGGFAFGFEIRPDAIFAALVDMTGAPVFTRRVALDSALPDGVVSIVTALRDAALAATPSARQKLLGAGIVMPGPFGHTGISGYGTDLPGWQGVCPEALFQAALGLPIEVSNDANAAAMAERITGIAHGLKTYAYLYFGTGLGLGLVSQGHLIRGAYGNAGEMGHIHVPTPSGPAALETMLSRLSVQQKLESCGLNAIDFKAIDALYAAHNPNLLAWLDDAVFSLGYAVQIIENLFDPETIILGGAMPGAVLDHLISNVVLPEKSVSNRPDARIKRLQSGASGQLSATLGAASLVLNHTFSPQISAMR